MPRQGDGSGDNGPIEEHEIVHGASGDASLQHTKHEAPMPAQEKGDALPGMNAAGGASGPFEHDEHDHTAVSASAGQDADTTSHSHAKSKSSTSGSSGDKASTGAAAPAIASTSTTSSSKDTKSKASHGHEATEGLHDPHDLEQISREKAEKYVNLDDDDEHSTSAGAGAGAGAGASEQKDKKAAPAAPSKAKASANGADASKHDTPTKKAGAAHDDENRGQKRYLQETEPHHENEFEQAQREKAAKFVNLEDE